MALFVFAGCATPIHFGVDGFNHGGKKDIVKVVFKDPIGNNVPAEHLEQLKTYPKTALIQNKRLVILTDKKGSLTNLKSHDVEIKPAVDYTVQDARTAVAYGCLIKLDLRIADTESGAYTDGGSGLDLEGRSAQMYKKLRFGNHGVNVDYNVLFSNAYKKALDKLVARINEIYPINGTVMSIKNKGELTEFRLDRGTNFGITSGSEFHIYYVDPDQNVTWVAVAYGHIGKESSQVTVAHWNTADPEVADELIPRIRRRDKELLGNLFFVCTTPQNQQ